VILLRGKVYAAASGPDLTRLFDRLVKVHPGDTPTLAYVPAAQTLVLRAVRIAASVECHTEHGGTRPSSTVRKHPGSRGVHSCPAVRYARSRTA